MILLITLTALSANLMMASPETRINRCSSCVPVQILDSKISIVNQNHTGEESKWLTADHFNLTAPLLKVKGPDVSARIDNMTFQTVRWGKSTLWKLFLRISL